MSFILNVDMKPALILCRFHINWTTNWEKSNRETKINKSQKFLFYKHFNRSSFVCTISLSPTHIFLTFTEFDAEDLRWLHYPAWIEKDL